jgi:SAM-dependent methyltransferase
MFDLIIQYYRKQQFHPDILGLFVNPFYIARRGLFINIAMSAKFVRGRILDVGCGQKPYEKLFKCDQYIGLELDSEDNRKNSKADLFYDGGIFPFNNNEFDSIVVNQVFEHVFHPDLFLSEVRRVSKKGGMLLMTVPFIWDEHEQPRDYARYSSFGIQSLLLNHGFEIVELRKSINDIRVLFQLLTGYIYKKINSKNKYLNLVTTLLLMAPFNIMGELVAKMLPKNDDLYLDTIILARKIKDV